MPVLQSLLHAALLALSASFALSQSVDCSFQGRQGFYDLSPLTGTQISGSDTVPPNWYYFLNVCGVATGTDMYSCTSLTPAAMVCQVYVSNPYRNVYADAFPSGVVYSEISAPFTGVQLTAYGAAASDCPLGFRAAVIQIKCDPNVRIVPTQLSSYVVENPMCTYVLQFAHATACPSSSTTTPAPSNFSVSVVPASLSVSAGSIFPLLLNFIQPAGLPLFFEWKASGLPVGLSGSFEPPIGTGNTQAVLELNAAGSMAAGTYKFQILAQTAQGDTSAQVTITVSSASDSNSASSVL